VRGITAVAWGKQYPIIGEGSCLLFYSPYRISRSDKLSQRGIHPLVPAIQARFTRFTEPIAAALFLSNARKIGKRNLRREGLTEEAAIEAVLEGARAQDEVIPGIILVALR
jgi:hypothetical protein